MDPGPGKQTGSAWPPGTPGAPGVGCTGSSWTIQANGWTKAQPDHGAARTKASKAHKALADRLAPKVYKYRRAAKARLRCLAPQGIIAPQSSAAAIAEMRRDAEMDRLMQEQAQQAGRMRIVEERNRQLEQQLSAPARLLQERMQQVFVPKAPVHRFEEAYVAPPVRPPRIQVNPYAQNHGPVEPGNLRLLDRNQPPPPPPPAAPQIAASSRRPPPPQPPKSRTRVASPVAMRDTEKRVGGQWERAEGTWKKKKPAPKEPVQVPIAEPKPKRKEPEATVQPADYVEGQTPPRAGPQGRGTS